MDRYDAIYHDCTGCILRFLLETSFSQKMKTGWTKEQLMVYYYGPTEKEYERGDGVFEKDQAGGEGLEW